LSVEDYDEVLAHAQRPPTCKAPPSAAGAVAGPASRPVADYALSKVLHGDRSARFRSENILDLELDLPDRSTRDYAAPSQQQQLYAAQQQQQYEQQQLYAQYQSQFGGDAHSMAAAMAAAAAQGIDGDLDDFPQPSVPHEQDMMYATSANVSAAAMDDVCLFRPFFCFFFLLALLCLTPFVSYGCLQRPRTARSNSRFN
jgi:hypothetical protein